MKRSTRIWLMVAACLILFGSGMFAVIMTYYHWDFSKLATVKYEKKEYEIRDAFHGISIHVDVADITIAESEDGICRVECYQEENMGYSVVVKDGILHVKSENDRDWYEHIGIGFESPKITIYLPKSMDISNVTIKASTGDIKMSNISVETLEIITSTGDVNLFGVICHGDLKIDADTGDIYFKDADAAEIFVKTGTGDVTGILLSDKMFDVETDTGEIDVPRTTEGGKCQIRTNTGDVKITISGSVTEGE